MVEVDLRHAAQARRQVKSDRATCMLGSCCRNKLVVAQHGIAQAGNNYGCKGCVTGSVQMCKPVLAVSRQCKESVAQCEYGSTAAVHLVE